MAPRTEPQVALGKAIKQIRLERGLSQEQAAYNADLHPTWLSHVESGRNPAWGTVRRIAAGLGVQLSELARVAEEIEASGAAETVPSRGRDAPAEKAPGRGRDAPAEKAPSRGRDAPAEKASSSRGRNASAAKAPSGRGRGRAS
jgi:transcriptional regulator with XRE-family HTH domain